ncbi:MAG TPA: hypothetical protein VFO41_01235 [Alphaproteobacteria bacterium]|nr:hypothetical protein [Alphaproteobacteria bacterium]
MKPRFADFDIDLFGAMADRLRAAADELRLADKARRRHKAMAMRLETYAKAIESDLQDDIALREALTPPPKRAES